MDKLTLTAGVARVDITPPVGFRMQGLMRRSGPSVGVESPLHATALVLADEETKVVVVDCDLIGLDLPLANTIRQTIGDRVGTHAHNVMVGCTHTHNGPCTSRGNLGRPAPCSAKARARSPPWTSTSPTWWSAWATWPGKPTANAAPLESPPAGAAPP